MEKTVDHLKEAFAGESQANRRYLAFAAIAASVTVAQRLRRLHAQQSAR